MLTNERLREIVARHADEASGRSNALVDYALLHDMARELLASREVGTDVRRDAERIVTAFYLDNEEIGRGTRLIEKIASAISAHTRAAVEAARAEEREAIIAKADDIAQAYNDAYWPEQDRMQKETGSSPPERVRVEAMKIALAAAIRARTGQ